jgi:hypothetical protein
MFKMKTEIKVYDIKPSLAISRNNTINRPASRGQPSQESVEVAPSSCVTSDVSPINNGISRICCE